MGDAATTRIPAPCPFCGDKPSVIPNFSDPTRHALYHGCKVVGAMHIDWAPLTLILQQWNKRHA